MSTHLTDNAFKMQDFWQPLGTRQNKGVSEQIEFDGRKTFELCVYSNTGGDSVLMGENWTKGRESKREKKEKIAGDECFTPRYLYVSLSLPFSLYPSTWLSTPGHPATLRRISGSNDISKKELCIDLISRESLRRACSERKSIVFKSLPSLLNWMNCALRKLAPARSIRMSAYYCIAVPVNRVGMLYVPLFTMIYTYERIFSVRILALVKQWSKALNNTHLIRLFCIPG